MRFNPPGAFHLMVSPSAYPGMVVPIGSQDRDPFPVYVRVVGQHQRQRNDFVCVQVNELGHAWSVAVLADG